MAPVSGVCRWPAELFACGLLSGSAGVFWLELEGLLGFIGLFGLEAWFGFDGLFELGRY